MNFLWALPYMLPCGECGYHFLQTLRAAAQSQQQQPPHQQQSSIAGNMAMAPGAPHIPELACMSRDDLVRTLATIHNGINQHNGKRVWSLPEVNQFYARAPICVRNNATWPSDTSL